MKHNLDIEAFLALIKAGLWEKEVRLSAFDKVGFDNLYRIACGQAVVGLLAAGLEQATDVEVPRKAVMSVMTHVLQLEQTNKAMNVFIAELLEKLRKAGIVALLVKGQGIAQCYERPLWRGCGDVDLLLDAENYAKAKAFLSPMASEIDEEQQEKMHLGLKIGQWDVELHGTLHSRLGKKIDRVLDQVQDDTLRNMHVRWWKNGNVDVPLPAPDNDVFFVFSHILQHFFRGGIGLRQICDWCRLLWTYREDIDVRLLESRLRDAGMLSQWKSLAALAVGWLGMPEEAMPLYSDSARWQRKAAKMMDFIFETGNFGRNRDYSYYRKYPFLVYKAISFYRRTWDSMRHFMLFPDVAVHEWLRMLRYGVAAVVRGKGKL